MGCYKEKIALIMKNMSIVIALFSVLSCVSNKDLFCVSFTSMAPNLELGDIVKIDASAKTFDYGDMI